MRKLAYIAVRTHRGVIIPSFHRHDYKTFTEDNITYMIDGGIASGYYKVSTEGDIIKIYLDDPFEVVRCFYSRYDSKTEKWIALKDVSDEWLDNIIQWYLDEFPIAELNAYDTDYFNLYIKEKQYRNLNMENL